MMPKIMKVFLFVACAILILIVYAVLSVNIDRSDYASMSQYHSAIIYKFCALAMLMAYITLFICSIVKLKDFE